MLKMHSILTVLNVKSRLFLCTSSNQTCSVVVNHRGGSEFCSNCKNYEFVCNIEWQKFIFLCGVGRPYKTLGEFSGFQKFHLKFLEGGFQAQKWFENAKGARNSYASLLWFWRHIGTNLLSQKLRNLKLSQCRKKKQNCQKLPKLTLLQPYSTFCVYFRKFSSLDFVCAIWWQR